MTEDQLIRSLGDGAPILADGRRTPDRREISLRWLSGTFLTGLTGTILMGVALFAAVDGRQQLAIPAEAAVMPNSEALRPQGSASSKGGRLVTSQIAAKPADKTIMEVSTVTHDGEKEVVRKKPFAHVKMALAANYVSDVDYPSFDPLDIFSTDSKTAAAAPAPVLYGSDVESEVSLKTVDFPFEHSDYPLAASMSVDEVEENVRTNGSVLTDGDSQVAALYYVDPQRFASGDSSLDLISGITARVVEENISVATPVPVTPKTPEYADDIIPIHREQSISAAMINAGYSKSQAKDLEVFMAARLDRQKLSEGEVLRIGIVQTGEEARIVRASLYSKADHQLTIAVDDKGQFIDGQAPPYLDAIATAFDDNSVPVVTGRDMPRIYDGIYRATLSYGMNQDMSNQIIKLLAASVDFQSRLKATDSLEAFYSVEDESGRATEESELLYLKTKFGDTESRLYRFQDPADMSVDYYDENGKSARQFLLRNPVPNSVIRSGFGMRRHPILGYMRMHTGVDFAAKRGTPIIAAGDGVVIKASWDSGGYGNQTLLRHANGYVSSYNHQNAFAKGVVPGAKVRQGQVIGWVGTTGLSTGPHLHYELIVNSNKVDPQRIRLPGGKSLAGEALAKFTDERKRIDTLLGTPDTKQVAAIQ